MVQLLKLMLCSAGSGLHWFSRSLPNLLGTFCSWSWHSTQRAPWLMPFTSQLVPLAPVLHCQLPHCTTNLLPRTGTTQGQGPLSAPLTWVLNRRFSVAGRTLLSAQGFSNATQTYLLHLPHRGAVVTAAWMISMRNLTSLWLLLLWLPPQQTPDDFYTSHYCYNTWDLLTNPWEMEMKP